MEPQAAPQVPQTLEGWYVLNDVYTVPSWRALRDAGAEAIAAEARQWLTDAAACEKGDSAAYSMLTQKGDLMFVHYRETPDALNEVELSFRRTQLFEFLRPAYAYLSVIELGRYELTAIARQKLADQGIVPGTPEYDDLLELETTKQRHHVEDRLFRKIPGRRYVCFYPMSKRRSDAVNWYALSLTDRRELMRGHGRIGHKYHERVDQVIGGSVGLDDWEWGVSLHADDMLVFKKLVYEMRFHPSTALYAEFGPFYLGIRRSPEQLAALLTDGTGA